MKKLAIILQIFFLHNCYSKEYFCEFKKKVDSISFVESSEIENSASEENQDVLQLINEQLLLKINKFEIEQTVKTNGVSSIINYEMVKDNKKEIIAVSKNDNFILYFGYIDRKLMFSEFHDPSHVTNYFYFCNE